MAGRLGDILVDKGYISEQQLQSVLSNQGSERGMLGVIMLRRGLINMNQLGEALSQQFEVPFKHLVPETINPQMIRLLPERFARERHIVPLAVEKGCLSMAMVSPDDIETISEAELISGYRVDPVVSLENLVLAALDRGYDDRIVARQTIVDMKMTDLANTEEKNAEETIVLKDEDETAPVIRLVRAILNGALNAGASDIHLEPHSPEMRVRYRVDGQLQQVMTIPNHIEDSVVARIKVMADMNTTETRRPQDGHLSVEDSGGRANFRISTIPTVGGEKVVMRVLDEGTQVFDFDHIHLLDQDRQRVEEMLDKPYGMIVVTGPTGSGKSTTMYAMLSKINSIQRNIVTVEDPVEYQLSGINQVASDNEHGMGFANALKYIMRQDPDVVMVGEIRDHETAGTAIQAALTGHLLISTLHTNDAIGAVARLTDLGIDPFKISGSLLGVVAQRLLRSICQNCKELYTPNPQMLATLSQDITLPDDALFYRGRGCSKCLNTGYAGRVPVFEIMTVSANMADAIENKVPATKLREIATKDGMIELPEAALNQAIAGNTTIEEAYFKTAN